MKKKRKSLLILLILLLGISVGYALLSTTLKINGSSTITKNTWEIYWDNVGNVEKADTVTVTTPAVVDTTDNTQVNFGVTLNLPGDYYEFQVDAVNNGTIDAMVDILTTLVNGNPVSSLPSYIKYEIKYADGGEILPNHLLAKKNGDTPTRERVKVRIEYLRSVTNDQVNDMDDDEPYVFDIDLTYKQADDTAEERSNPPSYTYPDGKNKDNLAVGDEICIKDQCFNFIRYDGNDVVLLAKYNLNVGDYAKGTATGIQESDILGDDGNGGYGNVFYSTTDYWSEETSFPVDVYDSSLTGEPGTENYSVAYYVEAYKDILESPAYGAVIKNARLLTYSEINDASIGCIGTQFHCELSEDSAFISNTVFWLGSAGRNNAIWSIVSRNSLMCGMNFVWNNTGTGMGVRPVIVLDKANM